MAPSSIIGAYPTPKHTGKFSETGDAGEFLVAAEFTNFCSALPNAEIRDPAELPRLARASPTARRVVDNYNQRRLHSAIDYVAPANKLAGRETEIWALRDQRLEAARERRRQARQATVAAA